jgi:nitrate/nitrite-specific signal transduction histidine kinase
MSQGEEILNLFHKGEELLETLKRGRQFTEDLLRENERLRLRILQLESPPASSSSSEVERLGVENEQLLQRIERLERRFCEIEAENKDFAQRYVEVEAQNEGLANLYVATYQLHSTLDLNEVVQIITEILLNLIGAEEFAIFTIEDENEMVLIGGEFVEGRFPKGKVKIALGEGIEGSVAANKLIYRRDEKSSAAAPLICVPLGIKNELVGVLSIYRLLNHKQGFNSLDYELLNMLAGHAATALLSAKLYQGTERKLRTIEGFMNLLRSQ